MNLFDAEFVGMIRRAVEEGTAPLVQRVERVEEQVRLLRDQLDLPDAGERLLTYEEAARQFGVHSRTIGRWVRRYGIQVYGSGNTLRVEACALRAATRRERPVRESEDSVTGVTVPSLQSSERWAVGAISRRRS